MDADKKTADDTLPSEAPDSMRAARAGTTGGPPAQPGPDPVKPGESFSDGYGDGIQARRDAILLGMLPDVAFDGWTRTALMRGAEMAGYEREAALASFPGGALDAVRHLSDWADREMLTRIDPAGLDALKIRERIALLVRTRLEVLSPYKEAVRRSVAFLALPQNASAGPQLLWRTVDAMWYAAGDTATDYNYYTKRMLLSGVVSSTTLYWLEDRSEGNADSWAFLDRRIADVMRIGKGISDLKGAGRVFDAFPNPFRFTRHLRRTMR